MRTSDAPDSLKQAFDVAHEQQFSHSRPDQEIEIVTLRVAVLGEMQKPPLAKITAGSKSPAASAQRGARKILFEGSDERIEVPAFDRQALLAGNEIRGPAVIDEHASTIVLGRQDRLTVNKYGHLVIEVHA